MLLGQDVYKLHFPESLGAKVLDVTQGLPRDACVEVWEDRYQLSAGRSELSPNTTFQFLTPMDGEWPDSSYFYLLMAAAEE